jgi:hypothetical protein
VVVAARYRLRGVVEHGVVHELDPTPYPFVCRLLALFLQDFVKNKNNKKRKQKKNKTKKIKQM